MGNSVCILISWHGFLFSSSLSCEHAADQFSAFSAHQHDETETVIIGWSVECLGKDRMACLHENKDVY